MRLSYFSSPIFERIKRHAKVGERVRTKLYTYMLPLNRSKDARLASRIRITWSNQPRRYCEREKEREIFISFCWWEVYLRSLPKKVVFGRWEALGLESVPNFGLHSVNFGVRTEQNTPWYSRNWWVEHACSPFAAILFRSSPILAGFPCNFEMHQVRLGILKNLNWSLN